MRLNQRELALMGKLNAGVSHYNHADEGGTGNVVDTGNNLGVTKVKGNPPFKAQLGVQVALRYFTVAAGVFTQVLYAALPAALQTQLVAFIFGNSDFDSGFQNAQGQFPLSGWTYQTPFRYGKDYPVTPFGVIDATAAAQLQKGDLVLLFSAVNGGTNYVAFSIIRTSDVAYAKFLGSQSSDMFWLNNIRYILTDTSAAGLLQYENSVSVLKQSLFGKFDKNTVSPDSFKQPEQFQPGIVDIPITQGIDKNVCVALYINGNSVNQKLSLFISQTQKLQA